jgi:hypothetical protein
METTEKVPSEFAKSANGFTIRFYQPSKLGDWLEGETPSNHQIIN